MAEDTMYDILAIQEKQAADEAKARGDSKAYSIHTRQAGRWSDLARDQRIKADAYEPVEQYAEQPEPPMRWERKREHMLDMHDNVHLHRGGTIICRGRIFNKGENGIKAVRLRMEMPMEDFVRDYRRTSFYHDTRKTICHACKYEVELIKQGIA